VSCLFVAFLWLCLVRLVAFGSLPTACPTSRFFLLLSPVLLLLLLLLVLVLVLVLLALY
jgi:hypothetical protein